MTKLEDLGGAFAGGGSSTPNDTAQIGAHRSTYNYTYLGGNKIVTANFNTIGSDLEFVDETTVPADALPSGDPEPEPEPEAELGNIFLETFTDSALTAFGTILNDDIYDDLSNDTLLFTIPSGEFTENFHLQTVPNPTTITNGDIKTNRRLKYRLWVDNFETYGNLVVSFQYQSTTPELELFGLSLAMYSEANTWLQFTATSTFFSASSGFLTATYVADATAINTVDFPLPQDIQGINFEVVLEHHVASGATFWIREIGGGQRYLIEPVTKTEYDAAEPLFLLPKLDDSVDFVISAYNLDNNVLELDPGDLMVEFDNISIDNI